MTDIQTQENGVSELSELIAALRAGHQYSGIVDPLDVKAADALASQSALIEQMVEALEKIERLCWTERVNKNTLYMIRRIASDMNVALANYRKMKETGK